MTITAPPDCRSAGTRRFRRAGRALACAGLYAALSGCATQPATERQIGSGGSLVRYSSSQTEVDLTEAEQQALRMLSDRRYAGASPAHALDVVADVLRAQGYAPVTVERDMGLVEAGRSGTLLPKWRQLARGAMRARIGWLPAKPDHERVAAIVTVRETGTRDTVVRARFNRTVWDSNGDSRTKAVVEPAFYQTFFEDVDKAMCAAPCGR